MSGEVSDASKAADNLADMGNAAQKSANEATEILNAKNDPKSLTGIFQKEAKAQKSELTEGLKSRDHNVTDYSELAKAENSGRNRRPFRRHKRRRRSTI